MMNGSFVVLNVIIVLRDGQFVDETSLVCLANVRHHLANQNLISVETCLGVCNHL